MRPSARLVRAVTAERADLERQREHLAREAADLRAALARIEAGLAAIDEQRGLLDRLMPAGANGAAGASSGHGGGANGAGTGARGANGTGGANGAGGANANRAHRGGANGAGTGADGADAAGAGAHGDRANGANGAGGGATGGAALRGPAIREVAVRLLVESHRDGLHYKEWFALLRAHGHDVAGKDPLAVFLTQLTRSPVVRKSSIPGHYELDRQATQRLKRRIDRLHREYLTAPRTQKTRITAEINRTEKQLDEATRAIPDTALEDVA